MKLCQLLHGFSYVVIQKKSFWEEAEITGISFYAQDVKDGNLFVCISGEKEDGHTYINDACLAGAGVFIIEKRTLCGKEIEFPREATVLFVKNTREALAYISAAWFGYPAEKLKIIGITGTKGKTTTAYMIYHLLRAAGKETGLIGTIETRIGKEVIASNNTTPEPFTIQSSFDKMIKMGCEYVVMEVSSQGIKQRRIDGIPFLIGVYTNFEKDHIGIGEHATIEEYRYYKAQLFKRCKIGIGNLDDPECCYMFRQTKCKKYGYTCTNKKVSPGECILVGENIEMIHTSKGFGTRFIVNGKQFQIGMPGVFNVYNALAALQTINCLKVEVPEMENVLQSIFVKGRMQRVFEEKNIACYIDYAHNAYSLEKVLKMLRIYRASRILVVFGCGGNRSKERRFQMGKVSGKLADVTIITSDNPRFEEPQAIISDIIEGIESVSGQYFVVEERSKAIKTAFEIASAGDVILIAGKGHEEYQEVKGLRVPMSDYKLAIQAYKEIEKE